jgi:predicted N-formylglutamate amidohydrolase
VTSRRARGPVALLLTCEHGGNRVPRPWAPLFRDHGSALRSHRGYDIGAAQVAELMAEELGAPLFVARTSRLLVDLNRSPTHPRRFSEVTRSLGSDERDRIEREHYTPHRTAVEEAVADALRRSARVVHVAVHSFTPVLGGVVRRADVGLLYDPARPGERALAEAWRASLEDAAPTCVVRRNYPYRGVADGLTTALRRVHAASRYVGIELEMNQARLASGRAREHMAGVLARSLDAALR